MYKKMITLLSLSFLLTGCKMVMLEPQGMIAAAEKHLLLTAVFLMLIVVIPVIALTIAFAWRYREGNQKATYAPNWSHSTAIEIVCWSIPCLIIALLAVVTWISSHDLDPYRPLDKSEPLTIQAIALEWKWLFIYPEEKIATVNYVQFPVDKQVRFLITAEGPMNSFQIPALAGQIYAMAGMQSKLHLIANKAGDYQGFSANFSGDGFSDMKFIARASTQEEYDQWVKSAQKATAQLTLVEYKKLMKQSTNDPVAYFVLAHPDLFNLAIMKSMMPMAEWGETHA
jgi:cytochrome o ubiquinol oxidase subunit 2